MINTHTHSHSHTHTRTHIHTHSRSVNELSNTELGTLVDMILKNCPSAITEDEVCVCVCVV
jgi:hypothetical protein